MNKPSKSKAETKISAITGERLPLWSLRESIPTDIIARMEAAQQRFGSFPSLLQSAENERRLQLTDTPPESERQILRCAPPFDAQAEHEADLEYESRVDYASWQYDGSAEREDA